MLVKVLIMSRDALTDPKRVPFLVMAKYSPVLTDLMATTPTLTDRISIRPGKKEGTEISVRLVEEWSFPIKSYSIITD